VESAIKTNEIPVARELFKRSLHQRLDVSHNDDRCRVRNDNAMLTRSRGFAGYVKRKSFKINQSA
jgi:hypothetical protein